MNRIQIKARGFTFDAWSAGPKEGPLILLLHGLPRTSWEWHHQLPKLAEAGFRAVAPDLRGYCPGARPEGVDQYVENEFVEDILAIADQLGWGDRPFHLMATSIGSVVAWRLAGEHPQRVATLACINIPHPGAFIEVMTTETADKQRQKMSYILESRIEGNELKWFELALKRMDLPAEETDPYREALSSEEALRAVYNWYRALKLQPLKPVAMPTLYIWPPKAGNVSQEAAEANAHFVEGPYRFEILKIARNFALQMEPELITRLLLEHLAEHAQ
ncbi:MAG: alpha/beta hydrolase [Candidatus Lokiarchaeota archaeon]|nr:alpha/beta hydrolase [Candidatus Lokiarchaeota archaeon]